MSIVRRRQFNQIVEKGPTVNVYTRTFNYTSGSKEYFILFTYRPGATYKVVLSLNGECRYKRIAVRYSSYSSGNVWSGNAVVNIASFPNNTNYKDCQVYINEATTSGIGTITITETIND